jgi:hypothetical protein
VICYIQYGVASQLSVKQQIDGILIYSLSHGFYLTLLLELQAFWNLKFNMGRQATSLVSTCKPKGLLCCGRLNFSISMHLQNTELTLLGWVEHIGLLLTRDRRNDLVSHHLGQNVLQILLWNLVAISFIQGFHLILLRQSSLHFLKCVCHRCFQIIRRLLFH